MGLGQGAEAEKLQEAGLCVSPWGMLRQTSGTKHKFSLNFKWWWLGWCFSARAAVWLHWLHTHKAIPG